MFDVYNGQEGIHNDTRTSSVGAILRNIGRLNSRGGTN